eukprot:11576331-Karenia_brevis.AAC.1
MRRTLPSFKAQVWSTYGRPHDKAAAVLRILARRRGRRHGESDWKFLLRHSERLDVVVLRRRAARK